MGWEYAIGIRRHAGDPVEIQGSHIPSLNEWVRDYVDLRSVRHHMKVLSARVSDDGDVVELIVNEECATDKARRDADADNSVHVDSL